MGVFNGYNQRREAIVRLRTIARILAGHITLSQKTEVLFGGHFTSLEAESFERGYDFATSLVKKDGGHWKNLARDTDLYTGK